MNEKNGQFMQVFSGETMPTFINATNFNESRAKGPTQYEHERPKQGPVNGI